MSWPIRVCVALVFKRERNRALDGVLKIKEQALGALQAKDAINAFQWCKGLLNVESPQSLAVVQRFEADSKFFRCFAVVLLVLLAAWPVQHQWPPAGIPVVLALLLLALWRYMEQRNKATNQALWLEGFGSAGESTRGSKERRPKARSMWSGEGRSSD